METSLLVYILVFPMLGAIINGLLSFFGKDLEGYSCTRWGWSSDSYFKRIRFLSSWIGVSTVFVSFLLSLICFAKLISQPYEKKAALTQVLFKWIECGKLDVNFSFQFDCLSCVMVLVVTGIGGLIHLYSIGYMHEDKGIARYFSYLNFFIFAMLILVLGNNMLVLFIGWEGVGLASYLLIGFWYSDPEKARAGKKAFVTNRIGDFGFILGILLILGLCSIKPGFGKVNLGFDQINQLVHQITQDGQTFWLTIAALLIFFGACGKSAQIPLYVWLPDAMAGPTPVSALIHSATMVTAGVYLVVRLSSIFFASSLAMMVMAVIGAATALFAAIIGIAQSDIKKVLAYSTISQLGYMFLACAVGAPILAIFHLVTHAFFKACLFLGAGSVIHGMGGEQNIFNMGGLKKKMVWTYWTFLLATLAIAGFPPFSGFCSKDEILVFAYASRINGSIVFWAIGAIAALCTSFYMFRVVYLTFLGENRSSNEVSSHVHESPRTMTIVLQIMAFLSTVAGVIGIPHIFKFMHIPNYLEQWLKFDVPVSILSENAETLSLTLTLLSIVFAFGGLLLAFILYGRKSTLADRLATKFSLVYGLISNRFFIDEIYQKFIISPLYKISERLLFKTFDRKCIDGFVNFSGKFCGTVSRETLKLQCGDFQYYLLYIAIGLLVFITIIFFSVV